MYSKTQGHHCWWLNKNGKALANFDNESDVDEIISLSDASNDLKKTLHSRSLQVANRVCLEFLDYNESDDSNANYARLMKALGDQKNEYLTLKEKLTQK